MPLRSVGRLAALVMLLGALSPATACTRGRGPMEGSAGNVGKVPGTSAAGTAAATSEERSGKVPGTSDGTPAATSEERSGKVPGTSDAGSAMEWVEVRYVASEGVLLTVRDASGRTGPRVLIDGLFRTEVRGYPVLPEEERERLETAAGPYAGIDLLLATHVHGDHFSPEAVARYLTAQPEARFLSTPQAVDRLLALPGSEAFRDRAEAVLPVPFQRVERRYEVPRASGGGIRVAAYEMEHGPGGEIQNLGFVVELAGRRFLHVGDADGGPGTMVAVDRKNGVADLALLPYWLLLREDGDDWLEMARAPHVAALHWPSTDAPLSYFRPARSLAELRAAIEERYPEVILPPVEPLPAAAGEGVLLRLESVRGDGRSTAPLPGPPPRRW